MANPQGIRIPGADKTQDASAVKKPSNQKDTTSRGLDLGLGRRVEDKNRAGNWTRIEAFDGYGDRTTSHSIGTYIVNQGVSDDRGANQE